MRVAVTGATGLVGRFVIRELCDDENEIHALARSPQRIQGFESYADFIEWQCGDFADENTLKPLLANCNGLVHAAFEHVPNRFRGGEGDDPAHFWERNHVATIRCIETARRAGVERVVLLSSRAVFDGLDVDSRELGDDEQPQPTTHYGLLKHANEGLASLYDDIVICSLRPTGIYGLTWPLEKTKWWRMLCSHFDGTGRDPVDSIGRTEVHGADVAKAVSLLLHANDESVRARAFNCSDIVVSEQWLVELVHRILQESESIQHESTSMPSRPRNSMDCRGLRSLGWNPGGFDRLLRTLREIVNRANLRATR